MITTEGPQAKRDQKGRGAVAGSRPPGGRAAARVPEVDPRLRQRWVDTRRQQGRRRLRLAVAVAGVLAFALVAFCVLHSSVLRIRHVRVFGVTPAGLGAVSSAAGLDRERLMIDINPASLARAVETIPWVGSARVVRRWPATVDITVTHRVAVAEVAVVAGDPGRGVVLVDRTGRVLALRPGDPTGLPLLASLHDPGPLGSWVPGTSGSAGGWQGSASEVLSVAAALPPSITDRVASVEVVGGQVQVLVGSTVVVLGTAADLADKMISLRTVVDDVDLAAVARVDLRAPERPALTPSSPTH